MSDKDKLDSQGLLASLNSSSSSPLPLVKPKLPVPFSVRAAILVDEDLRAAPVEVRADEPTVVVRAAPGEPRRRELSGDSEWGGVGRRRTATSNYASMRVASTTSQLHLMCVCVPSQGSIASSWPRSFLRLLAFPAPPSTTSATIVFPEAQQLPRLLEIGHVELPAHLVHGHASTTDNREQGHPSQQLQPPRKSKPIP